MSPNTTVLDVKDTTLTLKYLSIVDLGEHLDPLSDGSQVQLQSSSLTVDACVFSNNRAVSTNAVPGGTPIVL